MEIYKVGMEYLNGLKKDKNSALFEYEMLKKEIEMATDPEEPVLFVIGGMLNSADNEKLAEVWNKFKYHVLIVTDTGTFNYMQFVNKFDLVLHQAHVSVDEIDAKVKQCYNYVPELFYKYFRKERTDVVRNNSVLFCGNNLNRDKELESLVIGYDKTCYNTCFTILLKDYNNGNDERISHEDYMKLLESHRYSLVLSSDWVYKHNWITSRFIESCAVSTVPLVTVGYDRLSKYVHCGSRVERYSDINKLICSSNSYNELLTYVDINRELIETRCEKFRKMLLEKIWR